MRTIKQLLKPAVESFPAAARAYRYMRDSRRLTQEPLMTPMGFKLIGNRLMEQGSFEPLETEIVKKVLDQSEVFINIGANIGYYCCLALSKGKRVCAFEPIGLNLKYLIKNIKANHWQDRFEVFPLALGEKTEIGTIYGGSTGASLLKGWAGMHKEKGQDILISTLDDVLGMRFQNKNCFILIDIEGAEKQMLEGAKNFLSLQPKPVWMVEITVSEHQPLGKINPNLYSTFDIFWQAGYESWTVGPQIRLLGNEEIKALAQGGKDLLPSHNFIFIEKGKKGSVLGG